MKKSISILLLTALAATMLTACGTKAETAADGTNTTAEGGDTTATDSTAEAGRTKLIVGFDAEFPPYGYMDDNGEYVGFDLDLAAEVCKRQGWTLVKQPIDWPSKDAELSSGSIDCIWNGFTISDERIDSYTWTTPYVDNSQVIVVAADSGITTYADLAGKTVGVQQDSSALSALNEEERAELKASFGRLIEFADYNTAFMDLEAGAIDAVAMDIGVAKYQMESRNGDYTMLEEKLASEVYGVGFYLGNTELRDIVQKELDNMAADGTFMEIAKKWGLEDAVCLGQ